MADGYLNFDTKINESGFNAGIGKLKGLAVKSFKAIAAAGVAGAAACGAIGVAALKSVASLEQNVGGVETLFKESADVVIENANRAYKTAGLSANAYMSQVTSFSASLLQSLGGDTKKAAEYADRAVVDMSDNANKMGTDMRSIQDAYQGFAKQNYTMLDNLKLGYGGTQSEMARLISDASKMTDVQKELGVTVDGSSMSFGNIVNAISVMQASMGIAGTTSKEAATTIEGSMNSAKAAWDNFLNGSGTAQEFADAFVVATNNIAKNLGEIIPRLASTIPTVVSSIYSQLAAGLASGGPDMVATAAGLINGMISGVQANAPKMLTVASSIISNVATGIETYAPQIITAAAGLISSFANGISQRLPQLVPMALQVIATVANSLISNLPTIINAGINLLKGLAQGIINSLPLIITEGPRIINSFADAIYSGLGQLIMAGLEIVKNLALGIWQNKGLILQNIGQILLAIINVFSLSSLLNTGKALITSLKDGIKTGANTAVQALRDIGNKMMTSFKNINWSGVGKSAINLLKNGISALKNGPATLLRQAGTSAFNAFKGIKWSSVGTAAINAIKSGIGSAKSKLANGLKTAGNEAMKKIKSINWHSVGSDIVNGIVKGVSGAAGALTRKMADLGSDALKAAKKKLGIKSPSRVFRDEVGKMMALGVGVGFEQNIPIKSMDKGLSGAINRLKKDAEFSLSAHHGVTVGGIKGQPGFDQSGSGIDWDDWEKRQRKINEERDSRPVYLGTDRIDRRLPKGAVPVW